MSYSLFSRPIKSTWVLTLLLISLVELLPTGTMPVALFYLYYGVKVAAFFALGFLSPLAFYKLNRIGLGIFCSLASAVLIEILQNLLHNGHAFHWHELAGKLALISLGFAFALERRYERRICLGPFDITLRTNDGDNPYGL